MTNHYKILGSTKNSSQNKIFKRFRKLMIKGNSQNTLELFFAYLTLQEEPRKYYNILLQQDQENKNLNLIYLKILKQMEHKAERIHNKYKKEPESFLKLLSKNPFSIILISSLGPLTGSNLSTTLQLGLGFLLSVIIFSIVRFSNSHSLYFGISFFLLIFGILLCQNGITKWRQELFDELLLKFKD